LDSAPTEWDVSDCQRSGGRRDRAPDHRQQTSLLGRHFNGCAKTHLAIALALRACQQRKRVLFSAALDLLDQLRAAHVSRTLPRFIDTLGRLDLLVIDELGYTPMDDQAANLFFQLVNHLYTRVAVIITTNVTFDAWGTVFGGNAVIASAILDRLLHHSHVLSTGIVSTSLH
jgi:DNA replication protein DnaC